MPRQAASAEPAARRDERSPDRPWRRRCAGDETTTATRPGPISSLIDGGRGQLSAARETLAALGITDVPLVAIAKGPDRDAGRETFFMPGREPFKLKPRDPVLYFVERLRDEAHRFAIGSHRAAAHDATSARPACRKSPASARPASARCCSHFGTLKAIERASVADLAKVPGISAETARKIYDFFHERAARRRRDPVARYACRRSWHACADRRAYSWEELG